MKAGIGVYCNDDDYISMDNFEMDFVGKKIFRELTEKVFNPIRVKRICEKYNIEEMEYMDII